MLLLCRRTRIDELAPSDCRQDAFGSWTCFFQNTAKDCESGDIIRWDSREEATKYPVQCRASSEQERTTAASGATSEGRPFSYQQTDLSDVQADVDPRTGSGGEAGGGATRDMGQGGADLYSTP
jgi:hypothetical protein